MIKDKFNRSGKEQYRQLDTPKTEEKTTTVNTEGNKSEAPKKKKTNHPCISCTECQRWR